MDLASIDGSTRLYAILGDPIAAVRSPQVFNAMFARQRIPAVLVPLHVAQHDFPTAWAGLRAMHNLAGVVFTMPHKQAAVLAVDELLETGRALGAINAARREPDGRWIGDMFDGRGFVQGLRLQGHEVAGRNVYLVGLGGAGGAIAMALAEAGARLLVLNDVDTGRRERVIEQIRRSYPAATAMAGGIEAARFDIVANATPLGMAVGDSLPFDPTPLPASTLVVDVITKPEMTPLLRLAQSTGHRIHTGVHMHLGQAIGVARFFGYQLAP